MTHERDEKRAAFAALAMQAGLSALLGMKDYLKESEVSARHREACMFAWRSADIMLETEAFAACEHAAAAAALVRVIEQAEAAAARLDDEAAAAIEDSHMSDAPGATARAAHFAAEQRRAALRITEAVALCKAFYQ